MSFRPILSAALTLSVIVASAGTAERAADLDCQPIRLTCSGFEPNWLFDLRGDGTIRFTDPENPDWESRPLTASVCARQLSSGTIEIVSAAPLNLSSIVRAEQCIEPNEEVRPFSIDASFVQGAAGGANPAQVSGVGCCWQGAR
ncbi:MAG TPA: hypothetical protein VHG92_14605 [Afifellaceae bacterium]|nr:hypothetical protein [Afifellaceae bacterium]